MRKVLLGLTTALALGALAVPTIASAAQNNGGSMGAGNANVRGTQNFAVNNNARINRNAGTWNGKRWADDDGRHHRRHDRDRFFGFVPFAAYGDYAAYDSCWQTILTPAGFQRVYICGPNGYGTY